MYNLRNKLKKKKPNFSRLSFRMSNSPHVKSLVLRLTILTPKKPNSALRHVAKIFIYKTQLKNFSRIPGIGYLPAKYNRVLNRGGRANDLPSVRLTLVRGAYDFAGLYSKKKRRSFYGTPRLEKDVKHIRRKYRKLFM